jgi:hypothetical protein
VTLFRCCASGVLGVAAGCRSPWQGFGRASASTPYSHRSCSIEAKRRKVSRHSCELQWGRFGIGSMVDHINRPPPRSPIPHSSSSPRLSLSCTRPRSPPPPPSPDLPHVVVRSWLSHRLNPGLTPSATPIFLLVRRPASSLASRTAGRIPHIHLHPRRPAAARVAACTLRPVTSCSCLAPRGSPRRPVLL